MFNPGGDLRSHAVASAVSSALRGLTAVFGMGTGVSPAVWPPGKPKNSQQLTVRKTESGWRTASGAELRLTRLVVMLNEVKHLNVEILPPDRVGPPE